MPVIYNLDSSEFFVGTFGPIVPETIDKWVDAHAADGVTELFVNVNAQRTNYRSDVWELMIEGSDQPLDVRLNGAACPYSALEGPRRVYDAPAEALSDGYNLIEVNARQDVKITWVEISVR